MVTDQNPCLVPTKYIQGIPLKISKNLRRFITKKSGEREYSDEWESMYPKIQSQNLPKMYPILAILLSTLIFSKSIEATADNFLTFTSTGQPLVGNDNFDKQVTSDSSVHTYQSQTISFKLHDNCLNYFDADQCIQGNDTVVIPGLLTNAGVMEFQDQVLLSIFTAVDPESGKTDVVGLQLATHYGHDKVSGRYHVLFVPFENGKPLGDVAYEHMQMDENTDTGSNTDYRCSELDPRNPTRQMSSLSDAFLRNTELFVADIDSEDMTPPILLPQYGYDSEIHGLVVGSESSEPTSIVVAEGISPKFYFSDIHDTNEALSFSMVVVGDSNMSASAAFRITQYGEAWSAGCSENSFEVPILLLRREDIIPHHDQDVNSADSQVVKTSINAVAQIPDELQQVVDQDFEQQITMLEAEDTANFDSVLQHFHFNASLVAANDIRDMAKRALDARLKRLVDQAEAVANAFIKSGQSKVSTKGQQLQRIINSASSKSLRLGDSFREFHESVGKVHNVVGIPQQISNMLGELTQSLQTATITLEILEKVPWFAPFLVPIRNGMDVVMRIVNEILVAVRDIANDLRQHVVSHLDQFLETVTATRKYLETMVVTLQEFLDPYVSASVSIPDFDERARDLLNGGSNGIGALDSAVTRISGFTDSNILPVARSVGRTASQIESVLRSPLELIRKITEFWKTIIRRYLGSMEKLLDHGIGLHLPDLCDSEKRIVVDVPCGTKMCQRDQSYPCGTKMCEKTVSVPDGTKMCERTARVPCGTKMCEKGATYPCGLSCSWRGCKVKHCYKTVSYPCGINYCDKTVSYACGVRYTDKTVSYACGVNYCTKPVEYPCGVKMCREERVVKAKVPCMKYHEYTVREIYVQGRKLASILQGEWEKELQKFLSGAIKPLRILSPEGMREIAAAEFSKLTKDLKDKLIDSSENYIRNEIIRILPAPIRCIGNTFSNSGRINLLDCPPFDALSNPFQFPAGRQTDQSIPTRFPVNRPSNFPVSIPRFTPRPTSYPQQQFPDKVNPILSSEPCRDNEMLQHCGYPIYYGKHDTGTLIFVGGLEYIQGLGLKAQPVYMINVDCSCEQGYRVMYIHLNGRKMYIRRYALQSRFSLTSSSLRAMKVSTKDELKIFGGSKEYKFHPIGRCASTWRIAGSSTTSSKLLLSMTGGRDSQDCKARNSLKQMFNNSNLMQSEREFASVEEQAEDGDLEDENEE